jgi:hypothetical protein
VLVIGILMTGVSLGLIQPRWMIGLKIYLGPHARDL